MKDAINVHHSYIRDTFPTLVCTSRVIYNSFKSGARVSIPANQTLMPSLSDPLSPTSPLTLCDSRADNGEILAILKAPFVFRFGNI